MRPKHYAAKKQLALENETPAPDPLSPPCPVNDHSDSTIPPTLSPPCAISDHRTQSNSTILDDLSPPCAINDHRTQSNGTIPPTLSPPCPVNDHRTRSGPNTEAGKKRSSMNAIRHGLSGRIVVLPTEDMSLYLAQSKEIVDSLDPETPIERKLAQTVADGYWRMERFRTVEEGMLAWGTYEEAGDFDAENENIHSAFTAAAAFRANSQAFVNLSIYEQRIQRGIEKAMKQLQELQAQRKSRQERDMDQAIRMHHFNKMMAANAPQSTDGVGKTGDLIPTMCDQRAEYPVNPARFVCSGEEIELECLRRQRCEDARMASTVAFDYKEYLKKAA